ncbi:MAG: CRISPR-associated protein [Cyanobacteria bacterium RU_5_0]|nr:CRISPR-associated protein [Cyanobacteria bacterium RU_5_0]
MHKRLVNQCAITLRLIPNGPILIKASDQGADPTKPDMEFVEAYHNGKKEVYLPGSSLKGIIRTHAERIVRTVGGETYNPQRPDQLWADDPLKVSREYLKNKDGAGIYKHSCFTEQMFGNTAIASHVRITDAYHDSEAGIPLILEERNSVAIDRFSGSTSDRGLFNFQVCTSGAFKTTIYLKNFTLAQLGLIGLVLRDLNQGWIGVGFGKSRGLGFVTLDYLKATVQYPTCQIKNGKVVPMGSNRPLDNNRLYGAGDFLDKPTRESYGFPANDIVPSSNDSGTPVIAQPMPLGIGVEMVWEGDRQLQMLFEQTVQAWKKCVDKVAS